jgi:hypothetical protein
LADHPSRIAAVQEPWLAEPFFDKREAATYICYFENLDRKGDACDENLDVVLSGVAFDGERRMVARQQGQRDRESCRSARTTMASVPKTNNPDLVAPLLADKFIMTSSEGKVSGKAESLARAKATKYDSVDYDDVKVTVFGSTAIATGGFTAKGTDASGKRLDDHERWTDTWVKMPTGHWQCVASHSWPIKM